MSFRSADNALLRTLLITCVDEDDIGGALIRFEFNCDDDVDDDDDDDDD